MDILDYQLGYDFGIGIDSVSGAVRGDSVTRTTPEEVTGAAGQSVVFQMQQLESTEELTDAITAGAEINAQYGFFSLSAKVDYALSNTVNAYSMYLMLCVSVTNSFAQMRDVRLAKGAADLWRSGKVDDFREFAGDGYIAGMGRGGLYNAVLEIATKDEDEKEEIAAKLEVGYGAFGQGFNAKAQFSKMISSVASEKSIKVRHMQIGGAGNDSSVEVGVDEMITKAVNFPATVVGGNASPFSVLIKDYKTLSGLPPLPNEHDVRHAKDVARTCGRLRLRYLDWINDIDYILAHPGQFNWTNENKQAKQLGAKSDELREAITELAQRASKCANNLSQCEMPSGNATVILDPEDMPKRKRRRRCPGRQGARTFWSPAPIPGMLCVPVRRNGRPWWMVMGPRDGSVPDRKQLIIDGSNVKVSVGKRNNVIYASTRPLVRSS